MPGRMPDRTPDVMTSNNIPTQDPNLWTNSTDSTGIGEFPISPNEWFEIESLSDLLAEHADMQTALPAALTTDSAWR